jgi:hypothetical protein
MSKLVIGYKNLLFTASGELSAIVSENPAFPVENLAEPDPALAYQTTGVSSESWEVDFGATPADAVEIVVAIGTNCTDTAKRQIATSADGVATVFDSLLEDAFDVSRDNPLSYHGPFGRDVVYLPGQDIGNRFLAELIDDDDNLDGYIRVGLWWVGPVWAPATGKGFTWRDETEYTAEGKARRRFALSWRHLPRAQGAALKSILHKLAGMGRVYLVLQDEETAQWHLEAMLCTISQVQETPVDDYVQVSCVALEADW